MEEGGWCFQLFSISCCSSLLVIGNKFYNLSTVSLFAHDDDCCVISLSLSQPLSPFLCIFSPFPFEEGEKESGCGGAQLPNWVKPPQCLTRRFCPIVIMKHGMPFFFFFFLPCSLQAGSLKGNFFFSAHAKCVKTKD